jgi:hypothetical protein
VNAPITLLRILRSCRPPFDEKCGKSSNRSRAAAVHRRGAAQGARPVGCTPQRPVGVAGRRSRASAGSAAAQVHGAAAEGAVLDQPHRPAREDSSPTAAAARGDKRWCRARRRREDARRSPTGMVPRGEWPEWIAELSVPVHDLPFPATVDEALAQVDPLRSLVSPGRPAEGVVWRAADRTHVTTADGARLRASFKVISNRYLLKHDR